MGKRHRENRARKAQNAGPAKTPNGFRANISINDRLQMLHVGRGKKPIDYATNCMIVGCRPPRGMQ